MRPGIAMMCSGRASASGIASYFSAGQRGFWVDTSDFSTMFQDAGGATPVTATGQPVGLIRDKSGNGNDFSQSVSGKRPTLQQDGDGKYYLDFDPANSQFLICSNLFALAPQTGSIMIIAGAAFDAFSTNPVIASRATASGTQGRWWLFNNGADTETDWHGTTAAYSSGAAFSATTKKVFSSVIDRVGGSMYTRVDGVALGSPTSVTADSATNLSPNIQTRIGAYGNAGDTGETTNYLDGKVYGLLVRYTPTISTADRDALEALMAGYLNP